MNLVAAPRRILLVRRDNIGDLLCTTPLLAALKATFPDARIEALATRYSAEVLHGNPDLAAVHAYLKAKHREAGESLLGTWAATAALYARLRRARFDLLVLAGAEYHPRVARLGRLLGARDTLGFAPVAGAAAGLSLPVPPAADPALHEVERVFRLGAPLGIAGDPPPMRLVARPEALARARAALAALPGGGPLVALHVSARKPSQRWPAERFVALARELHRGEGARFMLFWSPGAADNPLHPGDDAKAAEIRAALSGVPLLAYPTAALADLVGGLAACDRAVLADGGAMHVAAALGKPLVALFGRSDAARWRPWGVDYRLLQKPSQEVADIGVDEALAAYRALSAGAGASPASAG